LLLFDGDVLSQFLIANEYAPFRVLKKNYHIQCAIVEAVDYELLQNRKFFEKIKETYQKLLRTEALIVLDDRSYPAFVNAPQAVSRAIAVLGTQYHEKIDVGEAYTHSASVTLNIPVVSHDRKALSAMDKAGFSYVSPVLSAFDVLVFSYQCGAMSVGQCNAMRKALIAKGNEFMPEQFRNASFEDGLPNFSPRLVCSACAPVGAAIPEGVAVVRITPVIA
jgi:hypothetical protein